MNDLRGARIDLEAEPPLIEDALFHCQQAAEKTLKAFLTAHDSPFKKTHDLDELGRGCLEVDATLKDAVQPAIPLTVFAWEFRYPGDTGVPSMAEAQQPSCSRKRALHSNPSAASIILPSIDHDTLVI